MINRVSDSMREILKGEIAHLKDLSKNIYYESPGLIDYIKHDLGIKSLVFKNKYYERITREDNEKILELIPFLEFIVDNKDAPYTNQQVVDAYGKGYTNQTGLPVWVKSTPLFQAILKKEKQLAENPELAEQKNTLSENLIIAGDLVKRTTDLIEDLTSTLRSANLLAALPADTLRATIGGLNLCNVTYEFLKGLYDFSTAYSGDDNHRPDLLAESGMRTMWSFSGILTCVLYMTKVLFLPVALLGISIVMVPIFVALLVKDTVLYFEAKEKEHESSNSASQFNLALNELEKKENELDYADLYQLASMQHRQEADPAILKNAKRELKYTAIDLGAYLFIALASCSAITAYYFTSPIQMIIGKVALAATIIGVTTATAAKIWKSREEIKLFAKIVYNYCEEKILLAYNYCKKKILGLFTNEQPNQAEINHAQYEAIPNDASRSSPDNSIDGKRSTASIKKRMQSYEEPLRSAKHKKDTLKPHTRPRSKSVGAIPSVATLPFTKFSQPYVDSKEIIRYNKFSPTNI